MQLPLLSNLLGLGGPQAQQPMSATSEPGAGFAQLLAGVPVPVSVQSSLLAPATAPIPIPAPAPAPALAQVPPPAPEIPVLLPAAPAITLAPVQAGPQLAAQPEQIADLAPLPEQMATAKPATTGKALPHAGKHLPTLLDTTETQPLGAAQLPRKAATKSAEVQPAADEPEPAPVPPASAELASAELATVELASAELATLLTPGSLPPLPGPANSIPPERQLNAAHALTLPLAAPPQRPEEARELVTSQPVTLAPAEVENPPNPSPPTLANIPLARVHSERLPQESRTAEPAPPPPPPQQLANPQTTAPGSTNTPPIEASPGLEIELGQIIERLVENRIHARETRSEVKLAHPDFGRVTLALNLAGQDRLGLTMPDALAELRAAVGQAFAPPPRQEAAPPAPTPDSTFSSGNDSRSQDARRDQQSSGARSDQSRANTDAAHNRQFTTNRDNGRKSSGRGVLA